VPAKPTSHTQPSVNNLSFEDALARLEEIVTRMESGELALDDLIANYETGIALQIACQNHLNAARKRIEIIEQGKITNTDNPTTSPQGRTRKTKNKPINDDNDQTPTPDSIELF